ncbi:MAG: HlyD family secretion protein [Amaricoccus sp.]
MPKDFDALPEPRRTTLAEAAPLQQPAETPAPATPAAATIPVEPKPRGKLARRMILGLLATAALGTAVWYGHGYWTDGRFLVSTDDAYIEADFAVLAPKITGYVASVPAVANSTVKAGDPLVVLQDGDYRNALDLAQAQLTAQQATVARIGRQQQAGQAGIAQAEARVAAAQATRVQADADLARYVQLASSDVASQQKLEAARAASATAAAALQEAQAGVDTAHADLEVIAAQEAEAEALIPGLTATRDRAQRDLDDTVLRAPVDGVVGNLSVAMGDYVTPGKRLLAVVPLGGVYVEANFKETQIERLAPGTEVRLTVDAFPDRPLTGTVQGVSPASGSVFSLLPPENATGNFTKVVQRLPVRIAVPADIAAEGWLRPGLSVAVSADPRTAPVQTTATASR